MIIVLSCGTHLSHFERRYLYPIDTITLSGTAELRETDSAELVWLMKTHSAKRFLITFSNLQYYPYMNVNLLNNNADLSIAIFGPLAKNRRFTARIIDNNRYERQTEVPSILGAPING